MLRGLTANARTKAPAFTCAAHSPVRHDRESRLARCSTKEAPPLLDGSPSRLLECAFLRALGKPGLDKLALRALLKAHHLLGLALAHRLIEMRASGDPLQVATADVHAATLLAAVVRDALALLLTPYNRHGGNAVTRRSPRP